LCSDLKVFFKCGLTKRTESATHGTALAHVETQLHTNLKEATNQSRVETSNTMLQSSTFYSITPFNKYVPLDRRGRGKKSVADFDNFPRKRRLLESHDVTLEGLAYSSVAILSKHGNLLSSLLQRLFRCTKGQHNFNIFNVNVLSKSQNLRL